MYRDCINTLAFIFGLIVSMALFMGTALADPATDESVIALNASVDQNSMILLIVAHVVLVILGFIAGQQR